MRLGDTLHLSLRKIRVDWRRNLMIMIAVAAILGLVFVVQLMFHGMVRNYVEFGGEATDGGVIVALLSDEEEAIEDIEKFGGRALGETRYFGQYGGIILDEDLVQGAIEIPLNEVPGGVAPVLVSTFLGEVFLETNYSGSSNSAEKKLRQYEEYRERVIGKTFVDDSGMEYFVVGLAPGSFTLSSLSFREVERNNTSILNSILEQIATPGGTLIAVDNGGEWTQEAVQGERGVLVKFANIKQAYKYLLRGQGKFMNVELPGKKYEVSVVAGVSPEVYYVLMVMQMILNIACGILLAVAVIVVVFVFVRLVNQDGRDIKLYYSLGATVGQVRTLYAMYFLELVAGAVVLALVVAMGIVVGYSVANQELLKTVFELGFSAGEVPYIILW